MRFDEFVQLNRLTVSAVDHFDDYAVTVAVPPDWAAVDSSPAIRAWAWQSDPFRTRFCASAVLTQSRVAAVLDPAETFAMLCEFTTHLFPATHEYTREVGAANDGPGILGRFAMLINADIGVLASESLTRIVNTTANQTLIAQLTLTCLSDSPVDRPNLRLTMAPRPTAWAAPDPDYHAATPPTGGSSR